MPKSAFEPCIPTRGTAVPDRPEWIHEIKHDGYRLIIQRDGERVRLWTRNGHDWSDRFPLITEAALRNRNSSFVIDGEAVLLGVDGRSDFNGLHRAGTMLRSSSTLRERLPRATPELLAFLSSVWLDRARGRLWVGTAPKFRAQNVGHRCGSIHGLLQSLCIRS